MQAISRIYKGRMESLFYAKNECLDISLFKKYLTLLQTNLW